MAPFHTLLKRQIKQQFGLTDAGAEDLQAMFGCAGSHMRQLQGFIDAVNESYRQADDHRGMLERALDLSSQELLTANSELRAVFQAFPDLCFRLDAAGTILEVKAEQEADLYAPPSRLLGKRIQDIPDKTVAETFDRAIERVHQTNSLVSIEYSLTRANETKHYEARLLLLLKTQILVIVRDISARKRTEQSLHKSEEQLRQSQKMEAVGQLAGGVAHDFNNLLTVISGHSELMMGLIKSKGLPTESIEEIHKAAERAGQLTRQLLAFSRKQVLQPKVLDLNDVVLGMEKMARRLIGEDVELRTVLNQSLGEITADPGQIEQVIMNLVVNARDAMPRGGRLLIETDNVALDREGGDKNRQREAGDYVMLAITDTGIGMTEGVKAHLFEPFFTTKGLGKGTGLGLATCYGIVKQSGGDICVYSEADHGTTFRIYFPRTSQSTTVGTPPAENVSERGTETLLVVEDDAAVKRLTVTILRSRGYTVHEAVDGVQALELIMDEHGPRFDLIISDMIMPRMGGKELVESIRFRLPEVKVLFISGYTDDALADRGVLGPGIAFLEKPFSQKQLSQRVREVLDKPSAVVEHAVP
jgi:two-component system cell cycle sensor histidine kinase/response regulator CckA